MFVVLSLTLASYNSSLKFLKRWVYCNFRGIGNVNLPRCCSSADSACLDYRVLGHRMVDRDEEGFHLYPTNPNVTGSGDVKETSASNELVGCNFTFCIVTGVQSSFVYCYYSEGRRCCRWPKLQLCYSLGRVNSTMGDVLFTQNCKIYLINLFTIFMTAKLRRRSNYVPYIWK